MKNTHLLTILSAFIMNSAPVLAQSDTHLISVLSSVSTFTSPHGKHVKVNYCASPVLKVNRAILSCAVCVPDPMSSGGECSTNSNRGVIVELTRVHTQGHPPSWHLKQMHEGPGISGDSNVMILENGNVMYSVAKEADESYAYSGIVVLDSSFKVIQSRELTRVDEPNWIHWGGKVLLTTDQRVNDMYPKPNELIVLDLNGNEEKRTPIKGSLLRDLIPMSDSKIAIASSHKTSERNYDDPSLDRPEVGELIIIDLASEESVATLIPGTQGLHVSPGLTPDTLLALDEHGVLVEINTATQTSVKILAMKEVVGLAVDAVASPLVLQDGSIALLTRLVPNATGTYYDQHFYLVIVRKDGSVVHRKVMTTSAGLSLQPLGSVQTHAGEELIWIGASGGVYLVDTLGNLKYALGTPRRDNLVPPTNDPETGNWLSGFADGFRILAPSLHPFSSDSLSFE